MEMLSLSYYIRKMDTKLHVIKSDLWAALVSQRLKKKKILMQETQVRFLGQEDPLEKEMATHSSIFAWRIPWTEEPGRLQSMGSQGSDTT